MPAHKQLKAYAQVSPFRWRVTAVALSVALIVSFMPSTADAAVQKRGAGQYTTYAKQGVDGYVRQSGIVMPNCSGHWVLSWLDIDQSSSTNRAWVQIGMHQGMFFGWPGNCDQVRMYVEVQDCGTSAPGAVYWKTDIGVPATPNYPLYVNRTGLSNPGTCGPYTFYEYAFRVGSYTSSPKKYGWIRASAGKANAQQEVSWDNGSPDNINTNRWGLNHDGQVQSGYGLSLYSLSSGWSAWGSGISTTVFSHPDLVRYQPTSWRYTSFTVRD